MQAVISAGGRGTRLGDLTTEIPKALIPIAGKPILSYQLEELAANGIEKAWILTGHLGEKIDEYLASRRTPLSVEVVHEEIPLGTAGGLSALAGKIAEPFAFLYGDLIFSVDLSRVRGAHLDKAAEITLLAHPNSHPFDSDLIDAGGDARVLGVIRKNQERSRYYRNLTNAGIYVISPEILDEIPKGTKVDFEKEILPRVVARKKAFAYRTSEYIKDMGTPDRLESVALDIKNGIVESRKLSNKQRALFLDRDGTINAFNGLVSKPEQLTLIDGAATAIGAINRSPYLCFVVTNQPVVARNLCSYDDVIVINSKLETELGREGAYLDDIRFCPHHPDKGYPEENPAYKVPCSCRKPLPGMILDLAKAYNIDLTKSWMIGDSTVDVETAKNAGISSALVLTGEAGADGRYFMKPDLVCDDLLSAVKTIFTRSNNV